MSIDQLVHDGRLEEGSQVFFGPSPVQSVCVLRVDTTFVPYRMRALLSAASGFSAVELDCLSENNYNFASPEMSSQASLTSLASARPKSVLQRMRRRTTMCEERTSTHTLART